MKSLSAGSARGFTLMEAILASFLLIGVFLLVSRMFHRGLQWSSVVDQRITAVHIAEDHMARIRRTVVTQRNWVLPSSAYPQYPGFQVEADWKFVNLLTPSRGLEEVYAESRRRKLRKTTRRVKVTVTWGSGKAKKYELVSYVDEWPRTWRKNKPVVVKKDRGSLSLSQDKRVDFVAKGYDSDNKEIEDLFFVWNAVPIYGSNAAVAAVNSYHDGSIGQLVNKVQSVEGRNIPLGGFCRITASALCDGVIQSGAGPMTTLVKP